MATPAKKFVNNSVDVVEEMVQGMVSTGRGLARVGKQHVVVRADYKSVNQKQVMIISGGGSGHEPAHAGFVGDGMISGAVLGGVFASPGANAVESAIRAISGPPGCLLIVKNYTGDRLNFGIALEKAKAAGIPCEMVVVADDCALPKDKGITGRRGVAGTVLVHKVAGAAAAAGKSLKEVAEAARKANAAVGSMGVALGTCTLPGQPKNERLDDKTIEIGLGIHGEPGAKQSEMQTCDSLVDIAVGAILDPAVGGDGQPYVAAAKGAEVALLVNSLGNATPMELSLIGRRALSNIEGRGLKVVRFISGPLLTALDMNGFSLSVMVLDGELKAALDLPVKASAWHGLEDLSVPAPAEVPEPKLDAAAKVTGGGCEKELIGKRITAAANAIIALEPQLTAWDEICGDGDCGITMKRGATQVLADLKTYPTDAANVMASVADSVNNSMGGTSGALLQIFFRAAGTSLAEGASEGAGAKRKREGSAEAAAFQAGVDAMMFYGNGQKGFRTMLDSLIPAAEAWTAGKDLAAVAAAAKAGAKETETMSANAGRANYVNEDAYKGTPDPGAMAVAGALEAIAGVQ